jgi:hypothetical protein
MEIRNPTPPDAPSPYSGGVSLAWLLTGSEIPAPGLARDLRPGVVSDSRS